MSKLYIGLMSGTSLDGIDAALIDLAPSNPQLIASLETPMPESLRRDLTALSDSETLQQADLIELMGRADRQIAENYANAVNQLLSKASVKASTIQAIGSHGQTIRHRPEATPPFTVQIGDPSTLAELTNITVVADFRRRDIAASGQGAPLAPAFHAAFFKDSASDRAVVNIGGIANITLLPSSGNYSGYDTGPGNTLMDLWIRQHQQKHFDDKGNWAKSGQVNQALLAQMLSEPFFHTAPPKSTGKETFSAAWLNQHLSAFGALEAADVQATLAELTATSIAQALQQEAVDSVYLCGGGAHNEAIWDSLQRQLPSATVSSTCSLGISADYVEACGFAWLAAQAINRSPVDTSSFTGADAARILGGIYHA
ncbi:anhydro-N-acetylmuramic acid kinase [bacterium]|nr:anhydro-N-acetylmuramic acid kinase [bacterium]